MYQKYFKLFSKDINIPSPMSIGINTIMVSSSLTQRANQLEIRRLANSISFNRFTDEKYIIGVLSTPGTACILRLYNIDLIMV